MNKRKKEKKKGKKERKRKKKITLHVQSRDEEIILEFVPPYPTIISVIGKACSEKEYKASMIPVFLLSSKFPISQTLIVASSPPEMTSESSSEN